MKISNVLAIILVCNLFSCGEREINSYFSEVYPEILKNIEIECHPDTSYNHIVAEINSIHFCHYESEIGHFGLNKFSKFMTSSPTINMGEDNLGARHGVSLELGDIHLENRHEVFVIEFPDFNLGDNFVDYLDSVFAIERHDIIGSDDILIPSHFDENQAELLRSSGGYLRKFMVVLKAIDRVDEESTGGISFSLKSIFGNQEDSFLQFTNVEKYNDDENIYYNLELDFSCNLYHWPQFGYEGLWGEVRNGKIFAKVSVEK